MPTQLNFDEELRYSDDPSGIIVPVLLTHGEKSLSLKAGFADLASLRETRTGYAQRRQDPQRSQRRKIA
jgi:hypothetical protein